MKRYVLSICFLVMFIFRFFLLSSFSYADEVKKVDSNKDGKTDKWFYIDDKGNSTKWVRDNNFDGKEDAWDFFKYGEEGRVVLHEEDTNGDGKVDRIIVTVSDSENKKARGIVLDLKDSVSNLFVQKGDSGWQISKADKVEK